MSRARRMVRNVASLALAQGATLLLGFVLWTHLGRSLGAERLGMLAFGMALVSYFVLAVALGFDAVGTRVLTREPEQETTLVPDVLGLRLALAAAAGGVLVGVVLSLRLDPAYQMAVLVLSGLVLARALQIDWVFQANERMGVVSARGTAASAVTVAIALFFVHSPDDLGAAAAALALGPLLANLGLLGYYSWTTRLPLPRFDRGAWRVLIGPALPLAASSLVSQFYYNADKIMLEAFRTTTEVGLYEAAYKLFAVAVAPAAVLYTAFYPTLAGSYGAIEQQRSAGRRYGSVQFAFGPPLALAGAVLAPDLLRLVFGEPYLGATLALRVLFVYAGLNYLSMTYGVPLMAWNDERSYFRSVVGGGVANVVLNVALILPFGLVGAAIATLVSEAVVTVGMALRFRRHTGTLLPGTLLRGAAVAVGGGLLPSLLGGALGLPLVATLGLAGGATLAAGWATGLLSAREFLDLRRRPDPSAQDQP